MARFTLGVRQRGPSAPLELRRDPPPRYYEYSRLGNVVTLQIPVELTMNRFYKVIIEPGAFEDMSANGFAGANGLGLTYSSCIEVVMPGDNCLIAFVVPLKGPMGYPAALDGFHPPPANRTALSTAPHGAPCYHTGECELNLTELVPNMTAKSYMELRFDDFVAAGTLGGNVIEAYGPPPATHGKGA